jgi:hypothetical protein
MYIQVAASSTMGFVPMSPRLSSPAHPSSGGGDIGGSPRGGGGGMGRGGGNNRDRGLIGQTVRIIQGPYKGITFLLVLAMSICYDDLLRVLVKCICFPSMQI